MAYTKEEAIAELKARGVDVSQYEQPQKQPENQKYSWPVKTARVAGAAGLGAVNEGANLLASAANLPLSFLTDKQIPYAHLDKYAPQGNEERYAFLGGELATDLIPISRALKGVGAAGKALQAFRPAGKAGLATDIGTGAVLGYLLGEREDENGNVGGRGTSAALGGSVGLAARSLAKPVADRLVAGKKAVQEKYGDLYNKFFKDVKEEGIDKLSYKPKKEDKILAKQLGEHSNAYQAFIKNPTIESAHDARSDLMKWTSSFSEKEARKLPAGEQKNAYYAALKAQKELTNIINDRLKLAPNKNLSEVYNGLSEGYRKEVVPFFNVNTKDYSRNKIGASTLIKEAKRNEEFMLNLGKKYPELLLNRALYSPLTFGAEALGATGYGVLNNIGHKTIGGEK